MVMRQASAGDEGPAKVDATRVRAHGHSRSAIGEPLHFSQSWCAPFYGLPSAASSWALVRLDSNEAGGVPLIDEVPVRVDHERVLIRDLTVWGSIGEDWS